MFSWKKWVIPGIIAVAVLTAAAVIFRAEPIRDNLVTKVANEFSKNHPWAEVSAEGRDLTLSGTAPTKAAAEDAANSATTAYGVRVVNDKSNLLPVVSPYLFSAELKEGEITLSGNAPDIQTRSALLKSVSQTFPDLNVVDQLSLAAGAPDQISQAYGYIVEVFSGLEQGRATLSDNKLSISGVANSFASFGTISEKMSASPGGFEIAENTIQPVGVSPYTWSLEKDAGKLQLGGYAPSMEMRSKIDALIKSTFAGHTLEGGLNIAGGADEGFEQAVQFAVEMLSHTRKGAASLTDGEMSIGGEANSPADFDAMQALATKLPGGLSGKLDMKPPHVSPYRWNVSKNANGVRVGGHIASPNARNELLSTIRNTLNVSSVNDRMKLASGEPANAPAVRAALIGLLEKLDAGQANMLDSVASISGRVEDKQVAEEISQRLSDGLPASFSGSTNIVVSIVEAETTDQQDQAEAAIDLPIANPYRWSLSKTPNGVTILGNVENSETATAVADMVRNVLDVAEISDRQVPAAGAPEGFAQIRELVTQQVKLLEAGQGNIIGNHVSVTGRVSDENIRNQIAETISSNLPADFSGSTNIVFPVAEPEPAAEPELPSVASPYRWAISKSEDGISVSGHVASEESGQALIELAKWTLGVSDIANGHEVASGKPAGFDAARALAIRLLRFLKSGKAEIVDQVVTVSGDARNQNLSNLIGRELDKKLPQGFIGQINIDVPASKAIKAKPVEFISQVAKQCQADIIEAVNGRQIQFETNRAVIKPESYALLQDVTKVALDCPEVRIEIAGHTDSRGRDTYNLELSNARAKAVAYRLTQSGVEPDRLTTRGYGESAPIADNETAEGRGQNRRIEFNVIQ